MPPRCYHCSQRSGAVVLRRQSRLTDERAHAAALRKRLDRYIDECDVLLAPLLGVSRGGYQSVFATILGSGGSAS